MAVTCRPTARCRSASSLLVFRSHALQENKAVVRAQGPLWAQGLGSAPPSPVHLQQQPTYDSIAQLLDG